MTCQRGDYRHLGQSELPLGGTCCGLGAVWSTQWMHAKSLKVHNNLPRWSLELPEFIGEKEALEVQWLLCGHKAGERRSQESQPNSLLQTCCPQPCCKPQPTTQRTRAAQVQAQDLREHKAGAGGALLGLVGHGKSPKGSHVQVEIWKTVGAKVVFPAAGIGEQGSPGGVCCVHSRWEVAMVGTPAKKQEVHITEGTKNHREVAESFNQGVTWPHCILERVLWLHGGRRPG